eukprot:5423239-Amphidinium_carterae.2
MSDVVERCATSDHSPFRRLLDLSTPDMRLLAHTHTAGKDIPRQETFVACVEVHCIVVTAADECHQKRH